MPSVLAAVAAGVGFPGVAAGQEAAAVVRPVEVRVPARGRVQAVPGAGQVAEPEQEPAADAAVREVETRAAQTPAVVNPAEAATQEAAVVEQPAGIAAAEAAIRAAATFRVSPI